MLSGETFGDAVLAARKVVYDGCPGVNTWGAYQCYGDHAYRLVETGAESTETGRMPRFVAPSEVIARLETIIQQVRTEDATRHDDLLKTLAEIDERIPTEWRGNGKILALLGEAYGELGQLEKGVGYYKLALADEKAAFPAKAAEQLWNLQARWAVTVADAGTTEKANELLEESERQLVLLMEILGKTGERLSLMASVAKRRVMITIDAEAARKSLDDMARRYEEAFDKNKSFYPLLNQATAELLTGILSDTISEKVAKKVKDARDLITEERRKAPDFWNAVAEADCLVLEHLAANDLQDHLDDIAAIYAEVRKRSGSPREVSSVLDQLDFLIRVQTLGARECPALQELRKRVAGENV